MFKKIVDFIDIDNLDVNLFHNQLHFDFNNSNSDRKRYDLANKEKNFNVYFYFLFFNLII